MVDRCLLGFSLLFLCFFYSSPLQTKARDSSNHLRRISHLLGSNPWFLFSGFSWCIWCMCYYLSEVVRHGQAGEGPWSPVLVFDLIACQCSPQPLGQHNITCIFKSFVLFPSEYSASSVLSHSIAALLSAWGLFLLTLSADPLCVHNFSHFKDNPAFPGGWVYSGLAGT